MVEDNKEMPTEENQFDIEEDVKEIIHENYEDEPVGEGTNEIPTYAYAGFWMRTYAFLIDLFLISCLTKILVSGMLHMSTNGKGFILMSTLIYLAYFILFTKLTNGQTLGKMIFGIQVVSLNEEKLTWQTVLIREGACRYLLKATFLIGYLLTIFTGKKQHLGDILSDTSVVTINIVKALHHAG